MHRHPKLKTSDSGALNLRNKIVHCFYNNNEYYSELMLLLLTALRRISKFDYKRKINS
jgi:hypothetical protein